MGVFIHSSICGVISTPMTVNTRARTRVMTMVVCTALCTPSRSRAPNIRAMMTVAPVDRPVKNPMRVLMMLPVEPTAASASLPTKLPTTTESTVLYSCWNTKPSISGTAKPSSCFQMTPSVMSILPCLRSIFFSHPARKVLRQPFLSLIIVIGLTIVNRDFPGLEGNFGGDVE